MRAGCRHPASGPARWAADTTAHRKGALLLVEGAESGGAALDVGEGVALGFDGAQVELRQVGGLAPVLDADLGLEGDEDVGAQQDQSAGVGGAGELPESVGRGEHLFGQGAGVIGGGDLGPLHQHCCHE